MPVDPSSAVHHAPVFWAQRKDLVYLTLEVENCKVEKLEIQKDKLEFRGKSGSQVFECNLEFYGEVDGENHRRIPSDRNIQLVIPKKEAGPFWPRLQKTNAKCQWLKVDFNKWKDEDDEDLEAGGDDSKFGNFDLNEMMGQMGGLGGERPNLGDMDDDSDNEDLPDLEDDTLGGDEAVASTSKEDEKKDKEHAAKPEGAKVEN